MDIGQDATYALSLFNLDSHDVPLEALAMASISVLRGSLTEEAALSGPAFQDLDIDFIKKTYSALVCLFLEASKNDLSVPEVSAFLKSECGLQDIKVEILCRIFQEHKGDLRGLLSLTANHSYLPQLLGVDWRLDYRVSSSEDRASREFLYHVSFNTFDPATGKKDQVEFFANVEELQDLMSQLKDACKSVERAVDRH